MAKKNRKWIEIEYIKGVLPNVVSTARKLKEHNAEKIKNATEPGEAVKDYACLYCGRWFKNGYGLVRHIGHCDQKKKYLRIMQAGINFEIGRKIFNVKTNRMKILRAAEKYEAQFAEKLGNGSMKGEEAERMFFMLLQGSKNTLGENAISFTVLSKDDVVTEVPIVPTDPTDPTVTEVTEVPIVPGQDNIDDITGLDEDDFDDELESDQNTTT